MKEQMQDQIRQWFIETRYEQCPLAHIHMHVQDIIMSKEVSNAQ